VLERRPASWVFVEVVRKKFVRKADKGVPAKAALIADPLPLPIAKGIAGPGPLTDTVVKRWCDHQPLHRQSSMFARDGIELARSTLSDWHMALAALAAPLIQAMKLDAFQAPYLCTDATGVLVPMIVYSGLTPVASPTRITSLPPQNASVAVSRVGYPRELGRDCRAH
jgi:transposase